jgi:single-strand DNA-binding protein
MSEISLNKTILIGEIVQDPNFGVTTTNNKPVANLQILTTESFENQQKEKVTKKEYHKIVAWGKQAEFCKTLKKGDTIFIEGKNQSRKIPNEDGTFKMVCEIVARQIKKQ